MRRLFTSIFSSPESLLQVMSQQEIIEAVEDGGPHHYRSGW